MSIGKSRRYDRPEVGSGKSDFGEKMDWLLSEERNKDNHYYLTVKGNQKFINVN